MQKKELKSLFMLIGLGAVTLTYVIVMNASWSTEDTEIIRSAIVGAWDQIPSAP